MKKGSLKDDSSGLIAHSEEPNNKRLEVLLRQVAASHHAEVIDLYGTLCAESTCRYALNGHPFFEDPHHLTRLGAEFAAGESAASLANEQTESIGPSREALKLSAHAAVGSASYFPPDKVTR